MNLQEVSRNPNSKEYPRSLAFYTNPQIKNRQRTPPKLLKAHRLTENITINFVAHLSTYPNRNKLRRILSQRI